LRLLVDQPLDQLGPDESPGVPLAHLVVVPLPAVPLGQVELTVSYSSKKGIPLVKPEYQNWSLTIF
jgi:hypothetical protein